MNECCKLCDENTIQKYLHYKGYKKDKTGQNSEENANAIYCITNEMKLQNLVKISEGKELGGYNLLQNDKKLLKSENFVKKM